MADQRLEGDADLEDGELGGGLPARIEIDVEVQRAPWMKCSSVLA